LNALKTSPKSTLSTTRPSQKVTKMNTTAKLLLGESVPSSPAYMTRASSPTPISPQIASVTGLTSARESHRAIGRHRSSASRGEVHATESSANETIRTSEAPQAKSQAGTGRSSREARPWADAASGRDKKAIEPPSPRATALRPARALIRARA
jgi:hypothetical protein